MDCREAHEELELYVLGELPAERGARVAAHLAGCARCRSAEEDCRLLVCEIKLTGEAAAPRAGFRGQLAAAVGGEIEAARRRRRAWRLTASGVAAAAALLVGLGAWGLWRAAASGIEPGAWLGRRRPADGAGALAEKWRYAGARAATASPADGIVVQGSSVYLMRGDETGAHVVAVDAATGRPRWRSQFHSRGYLAADGRGVYCLASAGRGKVELVALSAADGTRLWRYSQAGPRRLESPSRPVPVEGGRVCWTHGRAVHMLAADSGKRVWVHPIAGEGALSRPVGRGEIVYVVSGRRLHCLEAGSGARRWTEELEAGPATQGRPLLAVGGRRLYLVRTALGEAPRLSCMDLLGRKVMWRRSIRPVRSLLATADGVYLRAQRIVAMDGATGRRLWSQAAAGCGPLTLIGGRIHLVDSAEAGRLVALDPRTGRTAWEIAGVRSCDGFARVGDTGYIKTQDGVVHAISLGRRERL